MATVEILTVSYQTYASLESADEYLEAESWASDWRAETDDDVKRRALVTATRTLDKLPWPGNKTDADQALEWPRSATGLSSALVSDVDLVPQRITDASIVLAGLVLAGVDFTSRASTQTGGVKSQKAGSVSIEYFRDIFDFQGTRLPLAAWELIKPYLIGESTLSGAQAYGTSKSTRFNNTNRPLGGAAASDC